MVDANIAGNWICERRQEGVEGSDLRVFIVNGGNILIVQRTGHRMSDCRDHPGGASIVSCI